jgi:hypothetical protein
MTDTTTPQARRDRYAAAIREAEGWVLDGGQHMLDAVIAVADAEQVELRTRIAELESSCRDVDRLRRDWVEMRDRTEALDARVQALAAAVLPAPADRAAIRAAALREAADFVGNDDDCGCGGCDTCLPRKLAAELRRLADVVPVSGPGGAADETRQRECTASISGDCLREAESETACDTEAGECVHGGRPAREAQQPEPVPPVEHCIHDRTVHRTHHKLAPVTGCPWCTAATSTEA